MVNKYLDRLNQLQDNKSYRLLKVVYGFLLILILFFIIYAILDEFLFYHKEYFKSFLYIVVTLIATFLVHEILKRTFYYIYIGSSNPENINLLTSLKRINYKKALILFFLIIIIFGGYYYFPIIKTKISPSININQLIQEETPFDIVNTQETIEQWMSKAEKGEAYAQFKVGYAYYKEENYEEAKKWLEKAVKQNESNAQLALSIMYLGGYGVEKDLEKRIELLKNSADQKNPYALLPLWHEYDINNDLLENITEESKEELLNSAVLGLTEEIEKGSREAKSRLALIYYLGIGREKNLNKAIELWGNSEDDFGYKMLGDIYAKGKDNIKQDYYKAFEYYKKAADLGNASAQFETGVAYYTGKGVAIDYNQAIEWWEKATKKDNASSFAILGFVYKTGLGNIEKDLKKSFEYFEKAAKLDLPQAQYDLSQMYFEGNGVIKSYTKGLEWLQKASDNNNSDALLKLADMYLYGEHVGKNINKAKELWKKAAKYGNAEMKLTVSYRLYDESIESYMWTALSAAEGNEEAKQQLSNMENWMSKEDIIKAQELAAEYQKEKN